MTQSSRDVIIDHDVSSDAASSKAYGTLWSDNEAWVAWHDVTGFQLTKAHSNITNDSDWVPADAVSNPRRVRNVL